MTNNTNIKRRGTIQQKRDFSEIRVEEKNPRSHIDVEGYFVT